MPQYIFDDEDNEPMYSNLLDQDGHNPTVYTSLAEMKAIESLPFSELPIEEPPSGCWNCTAFDGEHCTKNWNNADEDYYNPDTDDKSPADYCDDWQKDKDAKWEDFYGKDT